MRRTYHTRLKEMIHFNLFIPPELQDQIPRSNLHRWKNESPSRYFGSELSQFATTQYEVLRAFSEDQKAQRAFKAYQKLVACILSIFATSKAFSTTLRKNKETIVNAVFEARKVLDWETCLRLINVSRSTPSVSLRAGF